MPLNETAPARRISSMTGLRSAARCFAHSVVTVLPAARCARVSRDTRSAPSFGESENAVKTQIWITVSVYVLVAIIRKRLGLTATLYEILQILSLTRFEQMPINQLLSRHPPTESDKEFHNQLKLFD